MPLADLVGKRERTVSGVEVSAPTVRTFFRALEVFGTEIGVVREAARSIKGGLSVDLALAPFLVDPDDSRLRYVCEGLAPAWDARSVAAAVARFVIPLSYRIDGILGVPGEEGEEDSDVDGAVLLVLGCAERFHIDPMAVMDWPLGLFLDSIAALSRPPKDEAQPSNELVGGMFPTITHAEAGEPPPSVS